MNALRDLNNKKIILSIGKLLEYLQLLQKKTCIQKQLLYKTEKLNRNEYNAKVYNVCLKH